ncbi:hypothetical protein Poli38472_010056 [Pythium oligandrum]|uniref:Calponin-homology (CH) domain-containing protein n=1 Tax=Pythium oligandrum TaxID=41045 RepID=A0A8K1C9P2_PYTOL|nr:hypothetical protein Poli38472_010056 [Pythium oligandrum]|eukprot:TMW58497.1 hypothetical protein Poli38472_010056 [Pythium oligandrum]
MEWNRRCLDEEGDANREAQRFTQQLHAALQSTAHLGAPNPFRTAICFDVLQQISMKYERFSTIMDTVQQEMARSVYITPPSMDPTATLQRFFGERTYFTQLRQVLDAKASLEGELHGFDVMHSLMLTQLRTNERVMDTVAQRWGRILLRQTLVDWKKLIIRKKYTRVLLEKTSGRWAKQRLTRLFRQWAGYTKAQKIFRIKEKLQQCQDTTKDLEELIVKMEAQIESAKLETKGHREHYDFAKRQLLSLQELLSQLEQRVHSSNERKLQTIVNAWGTLCLELVDTQVEYLQNMLDAVSVRQYADATVLVHKGEELSELVTLPSDALILRWINYQLSQSTTFRHYQAASGGFIQNFTTDMKNNYVLRHILFRILERKHVTARYSSYGTVVRKLSHFLSQADSTGQQDAVQTKKAPFQTKDELRQALEVQLEPPCPPFLSAQVMETEPSSDLMFCLFSFLACEHHSLVPLPPVGECPWKEAQLALDEAKSSWASIRSQWTELETPFEIREVTKTMPDLTSPPQLLVRANISLQNALTMVHYACAKRSVVLKTWQCIQRKMQQDAVRLLLRRARQDGPIGLVDRRLWREKYMLTTLHIAKLTQVLLGSEMEEDGGVNTTSEQLEHELREIESILDEFYPELRRVYRYYASIDSELEQADHILRAQRHPDASTAAASRDTRDEARFFHKIAISMSLVEFHVFLKDCRVFGPSRPFPYAFIQRVFERVNANVAAATEAATVLTTTHLSTSGNVVIPPVSHHKGELEDSDDEDEDDASEMTPGEFVEALVHIARSRYLRFKHASSSITSMGLAQRFRRMLVDVVLPSAMQEKERVHVVFHQKLCSVECREIFTKHHARLHALYLVFAALESDSNGTAASVTRALQTPRRRMLSVNGFAILLKHCELFRENYLNLDDVQHVFAELLQLERNSVHFNLETISSCLATLNASLARQSQIVESEAPSPGRRSETSTTPAHDELLYITYTEYLDALAAVACYLRPDPFVPLADKIDEFFSEDLVPPSI